MHHFPSLCPPSLSLSPDLLHYFPSIHLSISLLSSQRGYIILSSHMAQRTVLFPPQPPPLFVSIFHHNSLKGGISKSTNGRDLIGKCYGEGCLLSAVAAAGRTLHDVPLHSSGCFAWREAAAEDQLLQNAANVGKHCSAFKLQTERSGIFVK